MDILVARGRVSARADGRDKTAGWRAHRDAAELLEGHLERFPRGLRHWQCPRKNQRRLLTRQRFRVQGGARQRCRGGSREWRWTHVVANVPDVQLPRLAGLWAAAPAAAIASASSAAARSAVSAAVSPVALALILRGPSALR
eukprot:COSAG04_NODE_6951_length_1221_cov_0.851159_1_plen_142_part_00